MASCTSCDLTLYSGILQFYNNDTAAIDFFRQHGVLPTAVHCPSCNSACSLHSGTNIFRCRKMVKRHRQQRRECGYSVSVFKNTFLECSHLPPWQVLLFVNHMLTERWSHKSVMDNLNISFDTSVYWQSFCSEVCLDWVENHQGRIGGPGIEVEIAETVLDREYNRGKLEKTIWLFGGIERETKKKFLIPLSSGCGEEERQNASTLIPLITRHISQGSIIYSDCWGDYSSLRNLGYTHFQINHSENFGDAANASVHTKTIKRLWGTLKRTVLLPGIKPCFLKQRVARFQFMEATKPASKRMHEFLLQAARLYPGPQ